MRAERPAATASKVLEASPHRWANLLVVGFAFFWLAQVAFDLAWGNFFGRLGADAASFWSAGYIANHYGYAGVYDLHLMAQVQHPLLPENPGSAFVFYPIPTPYLPIFLLPFQLLALLPPIPAAISWIVANAIGTVVYLLAFVKRITGHRLTARSLALLLVSAPVFLDLFTGQVNLLVMIGVGEFLYASTRGKPFQAGLWLGLLLIKPQCLVLLLPALFLQRQFRTILGWALSAALVVGVSFVLAGSDALLGAGRLWFGYAAGAGLPTNDVSLMMNWRMLGRQLAELMPASDAQIIAWIGMILTALVALTLLRRPLKVGSQLYFTSMLGVLAATGVVAWHSHVHTAMIVIPVLLILEMGDSHALGHLLDWWVLVPTSLYFVRLVLAALLHAGFLPSQASLFLDFLAGIGLFAMNLVLLAWAARRSHFATADPA